jgi:hypothetical protein
MAKKRTPPSQWKAWALFTPLAGDFLVAHTDRTDAVDNARRGPWRELSPVVRPIIITLAPKACARVSDKRLTT